MEFLSTIFDWFRNADNRGAVQVLVAVAVIVVAWVTGLLKWLAGLLRPKAKTAAGETRPSQTASGGGVNVAGNARDITTHASKTDDPS